MMHYSALSRRGVQVNVPSEQIDGRGIVVTGRMIRLALFKDEEWLEGELMPDPDEFIGKLRSQENLKADIFTFSQKLEDPVPRFSFYYEWDSIAAVPTLSYSDWWTNRVSTDLRKDVKRAAKRGVVVQQVSFNDDFVRGIKDIYDETPVRQGRPFWHYHKEFKAVNLENATYLERSDFLGAFCGEELIGFLKIVYVDQIARLMQILCKDTHRDKRPMNALIAKAVELCAANGCSSVRLGSGLRVIAARSAASSWRYRKSPSLPRSLAR